MIKGGGQVISLKDAESQLARLSVKTTDGHTQSDKKMRVTVCGAPNGQIHVFSIQAKDLRIAEKSGFKKLAEPSRP
jgi:VCBS repeat-containing protein